MPTDLPPDYKPQPKSDPNSPADPTLPGVDARIPAGARGGLTRRADRNSAAWRRCGRPARLAHSRRQPRRSALTGGVRQPSEPIRKNHSHPVVRWSGFETGSSIAALGEACRQCSKKNQSGWLRRHSAWRSEFCCSIMPNFTQAFLSPCSQKSRKPIICASRPSCAITGRLTPATNAIVTGADHSSNHSVFLPLFRSYCSNEGKMRHRTLTRAVRSQCPRDHCVVSLMVER